MEVLRTVLSIVYIIACVVLVVVVLMQEGKDEGLGAISGAAESYWGKNKGRSMEGKLVKVTAWLSVIFVAVALILNMKTL
jgi:preprotein translocase subunit SecG